MLRRLGTGLLVTELIGQGVNYVTGDYSRARALLGRGWGDPLPRSRRSRSPAAQADVQGHRGSRHGHGRPRAARPAVHSSSKLDRRRGLTPSVHPGNRRVARRPPVDTIPAATGRRRRCCQPPLRSYTTSSQRRLTCNVDHSSAAAAAGAAAAGGSRRAGCGPRPGHCGAGAWRQAFRNRWTPSTVRRTCFPSRWRRTGGKFTISVHAAGELMPAFGVVDGIQTAPSKRRIQRPYYFFGRTRPSRWTAAIPFGLNSRQMTRGCMKATDSSCSGVLSQLQHRQLPNG